jgi:glycosyltransferase involved in cell wall biosynthesis
MVNILHISPSIDVKGGISAVLRSYLKTELPIRYNLYFVPAHKDGSIPYKVCVAIIGLLRMLFLMARVKIDIVHIHCGDIPSPYRKYLYFKAAKLFKTRIILHLHGAIFLEQFKHSSLFWQRRLKEFFEESDLTICLSKSWSNDIGKLFPGASRAVIPNGVLLPEKSNTVNRGEEGITFTFLGLIGYRKGIFDLLSVFRELVDHGLPIYLKIGGNGQVARLKREIENLSLQDRVRYLGWITGKEKEQLLRSTDIYVLFSYGEGMPISILEAMSYAIPVVSTRVGGIPELIDDGYSGFLVLPGDKSALFAKLTRLVENHNLRREMGRNARKAVEIGHNIECIARKLGEAYDDLLSLNSRRMLKDKSASNS